MKTYLLKRVENNVSKGEIACFEQSLLLSQSFQKSSTSEASESVYMRERVKEWMNQKYLNLNPLQHKANLQAHALQTPRQNLENIYE